MPAPSLIVARKEILDHLRDIRSLILSVVFTLMGPLVVLLVSKAPLQDGQKGSPAAVLLSMMSVFALVAGFSGGMNVAMDAIAGERERRSLLPLLMNPVARRDVVAGKWIATSLFAVGCLSINLLAFGIILPGEAAVLLPIALSLFPLALFAAALELLVSTVCRTVKEAQTYLSLLVFVPMCLGMFLVFFPQAAGGWRLLLPIVGQQSLAELWIRGGHVSMSRSLILASITIASAVLILLGAAKMLHRDEVIYGN